MSLSPKRTEPRLLKQVLTRGKPMWMHRYEQKISELQCLVDSLQDQLEESNLEISRLRSIIKKGNDFSIPIQMKENAKALCKDTESTKSTSPQFRLSL